MLEVTNLPTEPQPLPNIVTILYIVENSVFASQICPSSEEGGCYEQYKMFCIYL